MGWDRIQAIFLNLFYLTSQVSAVRGPIHDLIHDGRTKRGARELATSKWLN